MLERKLYFLKYNIHYNTMIINIFINSCFIYYRYKYDTHPYVNFEYAGITQKDRVIECPMTPQGIAATCDWALMVPCFYGNLSIAPKTVYVHHFMLGQFINIINYIPTDYRFVLVTSGTDHTIPTSKGDIRFQPLLGFSSNSDGGPNWKFLTEHRQIIHWFCENHDINHKKVSTLPTGKMAPYICNSSIGYVHYMYASIYFYNIIL